MANGVIAGNAIGGAASGAASGVAGGIPGIAIGAVIGLIGGLAKGGIQNRSNRNAVEAENRVRSAQNMFNEESAQQDRNRFDSNLMRAKQNFADQKEITDQRMARKESNLLKAQGRQDSQIKYDTLMSQRTGMEDRIKRMDNNLMRVGR